MIEIRSAQEELLLFGGTCLLGVPAGVLFDAFRLLRRLVKHHALAVAAEDVIWITAVSMLLLCYASTFAQGVFRVYYAAGCLLGFVVYECLLGRWMVAFLERLLRLLAVPFQTVGRGVVLICKKVRLSFVKSSKKGSSEQKNTQNHLQNPLRMVYNIHRTVRKGKNYGKTKQRYRKETGLPR